MPESSYPNFAGKHAGEALFTASAFVISDSLAELTWSSHFGSPEVTSGLIELYQAAVTALTDRG